MLSDLVDKIAPLELRAGETITFTSSTIDTPLLMVAHGEVRLQHNDRLVTVMKKGDVYGDLFQDAPAPEANTVIASERSIVFRISLTDFYFVIANHHELVQQLIKNVTQSAKVANL
jgi:CRP-like cAMP-binding protein